MKLYTIKLEDKAAVLNRLKAAKINVPSYKIHNDTVDKTFNISVEDPIIQATFEKLLSSSPRIDVISKKDLKEILRKMVRRELREWKIIPFSLPSTASPESQKIVHIIKEALKNKLKMDFEYKFINSGNDIQLSITTPQGSEGGVELEAELEIDDSEVKGLKPYMISVYINDYESTPDYQGKDTTGITDILNNDSKEIRYIDELRYDWLSDARPYW